ncbi:hypothetical protein [Rhizobium sp. J15]|uniref:hypothetical protein n=1 Tax=Rhizobium sp. J15 TaxID=2035450 RepID=UPI00159661A0|nr:hypothetical protein [Rhizobium sp. J15]
MTRQNAAMVEEASASTAALSGEAERLHERFRLFELGQTIESAHRGTSSAA